MQRRPPVGVIHQIPRSVWILGYVSLFMDVSSEIVHSVLPMFLLASLGASAGTIGLIEGIAEATAPIVKVFSGTLSDYLDNRKWLAVAGYSLGAISKPLFAVAPTIGIVVAARVIDRVGKGIRGAPRDALVADVTPHHLRGAAFGLRQSLDTVGAFLEPLVAVVIMLVWADNGAKRVFSRLSELLVQCVFRQDRVARNHGVSTFDSRIRARQLRRGSF